MNKFKENGILSVFQQISKQCKERERVEKTCIHEISTKKVQDICNSAGLSDSDFYDILCVSSAIANGMRKNGCDELETSYKGELIVAAENLRNKV